MNFWTVKSNLGHYKTNFGTVQGDSFDKNKVNFRTVRVEVGTVQDADLTKSGKILGQYKVIRLCLTRYHKYARVGVKLA